MTSFVARMKLSQGMYFVTWEQLGSRLYGKYSVPEPLVQDCAERVRSALHDMVAHACQNQLRKYMASCVRELAVAGHDLYNSLFWPPESHSPRDEILGVHPSDVLIYVDGRRYVPWGLMFTPHPDSLSDSLQPEDYVHHFWCQQYRLAMMYDRGIREPPNRRPMDAGQLEVLPVVNQVVYQDVLLRLPEEDRAELDRLFPRPACTRKEAFSRWEDGASLRDALVYFYCHADGRQLALSRRDTVTISDVYLRMKRPYKSQNLSLLFLNGCETAIGHPCGGFLEAIYDAGWSGMIGVEQKVPKIFALRFALAVLSRWLTSGEPIVDVMAGLRPGHFPLSLLFSLYCPPWLRVGPTMGNSLLHLTENLSFQHIHGEEVFA